MPNFNQFNSQLLESLKKVRGRISPNHQKLIRGTENFKRDQTPLSLVQGMFPSPEKNIDPDADPDQYIRSKIKNSLFAIDQGDFQQASSFVQEGLALISEEDKRSSLNVQFTQRMQDACVLLIMDSFLSNRPLKVAIPTQNQSQLAFFGVVASLDYFLKQSALGDAPSIEFTPKTGPIESGTQVNNLILNTETLNQIAEKSDVFKEFVHLNANLRLPKEADKINLREALLDTLWSHPETWEAVFEMDPREIEALSQEQRMLKLIQTKSKVIEKCLSDMRINIGGLYLDINFDQKNFFLGQMKILQELTAKREEQQKVTAAASRKTASLRKNILSLFEGQGIETERGVLKLLKILGSKNLNIDPNSSKQALLLEMLNVYQKSLVESAIESKKLTSAAQEVKEQRDIVENEFEAILNGVQNTLVLNEYHALNNLRIYTVFGLLVFNKDLFPDVSLKSKSKELARDKIKAIGEKISQKAKRYAFDKLKDRGKNIEQDPSASIQEVLDRKVLSILRSYKNPPESFKFTKISEEDVNAMLQVVQGIQNSASRGDVKAVEKFNKLQKAMESIFVDNSTFFVAIQDRLKSLDKEKIQSMASIVQAALLLSTCPENIMPNQKNSDSIKEVIKSLIANVGRQGIKENIKKNIAKTLTAVQDFTGKEIESQTINDVTNNALFNNIISKKPEPIALAVKKTFTNQDKIEFLEETKRLLTERFEYEFSDIGSFWNYENPMSMFDNYPGRERQLFDPLFFLQNVVSIFRIHSSFEADLDVLPPSQFMNYEQKHTIPKAEYLLSAIPNTRKGIEDNFIQYIQTKKIPIQDYDKKRSGAKYSFWNLSKKRPEFVTIIPSLIHAVEKEIESLSSIEYYANPNEFAPDRVDLLNNRSLYNLIQDIQAKNTQNSKIASALYQEFLPTFIYSFVTVKNIFPSQTESIISAQMNFIKNMPEAEIARVKIEGFLSENPNGIRQLREFLIRKIEENRDSFFGGGGISEFFTRTIKDLSKKFTDFFNSTVSYGLQSAILSGAILGAFVKTGVFSLGINNAMPLVGVSALFAFAGTYLLNNYVSPFVETLINTTVEMAQNQIANTLGVFPQQIQDLINYYFPSLGGRYTPSAPSTFLMDTFQKAFLMEQKSVESFQDDRHQMAYILFLQEMFETLENLQNDFTTFSTRIQGLAPNVTHEANFSVMVLNMWHMVNRDIFRFVPPEILQNASKKDFPEAVQQFLRWIKRSVDSLGEGFEGRKLLNGRETEYSRYLKNKLNEGPKPQLIANLESPIGRVLEKETIYVLNEDHFTEEIVNVDAYKGNIEQFFSITKKMIEEKDLFFKLIEEPIERQKVVAKNLQETNRMTEKMLDQATEILVSSLEQVRLGFSLTEGALESEYNPDSFAYKYLKATNEKPENFLSSSLFQSSLSMLAKTAQIADAMRVPGSEVLLDKTKLLRKFQEKFLRGQKLEQLDFQAVTETKEALITVIKFGINDNPLVFYPVISEMELFPETILVAALRREQKASLARNYGEDASHIGPIIENSRVLYLTNQMMELEFLDPETRGFTFSPILFQSIENILRLSATQDITNYFGTTQAMNRNLRARENALLRSPRGFGLPLFKKFNQNQLRLAAPESQEGPKIAKNELYTAQRAPEQLNPQYNLTRSQYDPDNVGIQPNQAMQTYGNQLPQGVRNQLQGGQLAIEPSPQPTSSQPAQNASSMAIEQRPAESSTDQNMLLPIIEEIPGQEVRDPEGVAAESQNEMGIMLGADGRSVSSSIGAQNNAGEDIPLSNYMGPPPEAVPPSFLPGNQFLNVPNHQFDPNAPNIAQGWGQAAAIGGGAILGASLLAYGLSSTSQDSKKRRK